MLSLALALSGLVFFYVAWFDYRKREIKNSLLVLLGLGALVIHTLDGGLVAATIGGLVCFFFGVICYAFSQGRFGAGDAKLLGVLGLLVGVYWAIVVLGVACSAALLCQSRAGKDVSIPFGLFVGVVGAMFLYTKSFLEFVR